MNLRTAILTASIAALFAWAAPASAHCDTLDGPVVSAARKALDTGDINFVLAWTQKNDDKEIRSAFDKARAVRKAGGQAKELADAYFFETLVRLHRAGEGAAYTGLKATGEIEPPIAAADRAITTGKLESVADMLTKRTHVGLHQQFERVMATRSYDPKDVDVAVYPWRSALRARTVDRRNASPRENSGRDRGAASRRRCCRGDAVGSNPLRTRTQALVVDSRSSRQ